MAPRLMASSWASCVLVSVLALGACSSDPEEPVADPGVPATASSGSSTATSVPEEPTHLTCFGRLATVVGTTGADRLEGSRRRDVIVTRGGDDVVGGLVKGDRVCTGGGDDRVAASRRSWASVDLGAGKDRFAGWADVIRGGSGSDELRVRGGGLTVTPGPGRDLVVTRPVRDRYAAACLSYNGSAHRIVADLTRGRVRGQGEDRVRGVQCLYGSSLGDVITGSPRGDLLYSCALGAAYAQDRARNIVHAAGGDDEVNPCSGGDLVHLGDGDDVVLGGPGDDWLYGDAGDDDVWGSDGSDHLVGGDGDDRVNGTFYCDTGSSAGTGMGDASPNQVWGGDGDDEVTGDLGADLIDGGPGFDHGYGGPPGRAGADVIVSVERLTSCP